MKNKLLIYEETYHFSFTGTGTVNKFDVQETVREQERLVVTGVKIHPIMEERDE